MDPIRCEKILFVGTGGGNDIFSTTIAMRCLWDLGLRWNTCAIAGVLSPFHSHAVKKTDISGASLIESSSKRHLLRYDNPREIPFIDATVASMIKKEKIFNVSAIYGLSIVNGAIGLTQTFSELANKFEYIVLVDVGGDIFFSGVHDKHVLSPMFDATVLRAFVEADVPGILFEIGPGTDGEVEPYSLERSLYFCNAEPQLLSDDSINWWERLYNKWILPKRPGRTVSQTIAGFRSNTPLIEMKYRARLQLGDKRYYSYFIQSISTDLCKYFYLVDPSAIQNPFAVNSSDSKDWFVQTQIGQFHTNNEANMQYMWIGDKLWQFVTPSPLFYNEECENIIKETINEHIEKKVCDGIMIFQKDRELLPDPLPKGWCIKEGKLLEIYFGS